MLATTHRSATSLSSPDNVSGLNPKQQRRKTAPATPLNLPEPVDARHAHQRRRSPSPLRNGYIPDEDSEDGSDVEEDDHNTSWGDGRPTSPASSVTKFATNIAQRVGSFMSPARSSQTLPTDAELEAEAERERERSMKEAERIIAMERWQAENRMTVEERVMAMLQTDGQQSSPMLIPQPSQSATPHTPSPTASQKEKSGWWTATMSKLTPTKEPLTAAQQVVLETKVRDKEKQKEKKSLKGKEKEKTKEWPSSPERKFSDPAYTNLAIPQKPSAPRGMSTSPSSSSPAQYSTPPSLNPSPLRGADSPSKSNLPLYAQFSSEGVLDVHGTLLTIAKRFEKLEKWTVSHVRALEDRMDDVERWLVEKEKEKEKETKSAMENRDRDDGPDSNEVSFMREELAELQGRVGEIGREMAKMATSPGNLSSGPSKSSTSIGRAPSTVSSIAVRSMAVSPPRTYSTTSPHNKDQTSPPITPLVPVLTGSRTRLPYPTGDYATPPDSVIVSQGHFSPTNSPPHSLPRQMSFPGLPADLDAPSSSISGLPRSVSPVNSMSTSSGRSPLATLPPPKLNDPRPSSVSPTPRKRYTVALGGPIMSAKRRSSSPPPPVESSQLGNAYFSSAGFEDGDELEDETVGKSAGKKTEYSTFDRDSRRPRPQSTYSAPSSTAPLQPRLRSRSTVGLGISDGNGNTIAGGKFVDPLVVRRQEKVAVSGRKAVDNKKKKAVGDLVAFFDGGEK